MVASLFDVYIDFEMVIYRFIKFLASIDYYWLFDIDLNGLSISIYLFADSMVPYRIFDVGLLIL